MPGPDPNFVAAIFANGQRFTAWESVMVERQFGTGVSQFQFSAAEQVYGPGYRSLQVAPGDPVTIVLAGQLAFTGYCTTRAGAYDTRSARLTRHEVDSPSVWRGLGCGLAGRPAHGARC